MFKLKNQRKKWHKPTNGRPLHRGTCTERNAVYALILLAPCRAYNEVDWADRVPPPVPPPASTVEQFPDPVSQKLTFRRYNSCPEPWQVSLTKPGLLPAHLKAGKPPDNTIVLYIFPFLPTFLELSSAQRVSELELYVGP